MLAVLLLALPLPAFAQPASPAAQSLNLEDLTWTEVRAAVAAGQRTVLLPFGGTEQNGPAMTLGKHNRRAAALAQEIARELGNALVAPVVPVVPEGRIEPPTGHLRFPGTLTVRDSAFEAQVEDLAHSLSHAGFSCVVLLGDHGGTQAALERLARRLDQAGKGLRVLHPVAYYAEASRGLTQSLARAGHDAAEAGQHAGLADTSLQLAVAPESVRRERLAGPGLDREHGVDGQPGHASAALATQALTRIVQGTAAEIAAACGGRAGAPASPN
jgi:creatinine amidohydrolase/Fe(II)-dependent formamide hydrolase-like protein